MLERMTENRYMVKKWNELMPPGTCGNRNREATPGKNNSSGFLLSGCSDLRFEDATHSYRWWQYGPVPCGPIVIFVVSFWDYGFSLVPDFVFTNYTELFDLLSLFNLS